MNEGFLVILLVGLCGKILWGWLKDGRIDKEKYLTVQAFNDHRKECCAINLKREFNICQQESCTHQAQTDGRLLTIEDKLREGHLTFQDLNKKMDEKFDLWSEKFDRMNHVLTRIQTVLEFALEGIDKDRKKRGDDGIQ